MSGVSPNQDPVLIKRQVSTSEAEAIQIRVASLRCSDVVNAHDVDGGRYWRGRIGGRERGATITINHWNPNSPPEIMVSAATVGAVARQVARLWPADLYTADLLHQGIDATDATTNGDDA